MSSEHEEYPDSEPEEYAPRSIFAAGWFRAVLVLTVLAIVVVVALPYLLNWFDPTPSPVKGPGRVTQMMGSSAPPAAALLPQSAPAARVEPAPAATAPPAPESSGTLAAPGPTKPTAEVQVARAVESSPVAPRGAVTAKSAAARQGYWVQLGLFKDPKNAEELARKLRDEGVAVQVANVTRSAGAGTSSGMYHVVRAGAFRDFPRAAVVKRELAARGHAGFITEGAAR